MTDFAIRFGLRVGGRRFINRMPINPGLTDLAIRFGLRVGGRRFINRTPTNPGMSGPIKENIFKCCITTERRINICMKDCLIKQFI